MLKKIVWVLCLSGTLFFINLSAELSQQQVQALSSLIFFTEEEISDSPASIPVEEEDLLLLWDIVLSGELDDNLQDIHQLYLQAQHKKLQGERYEAHSILQLVSSQLTARWMAYEPIEELPAAHQLAKKSHGWKEIKTYPQLDSSALKDIYPFLLPSNHSLKPALQSIFTQSRATFSDDSMQSAGFEIKFRQPRSFIRVASHPLLPGVLIKAYLDSDTRIKNGIPGWKWFIYRCEGAKKVRNIIKSSRVKNFVVPDKWIYPLPLNPSPPAVQNIDPKPIILIVKDMQLVSKAANKEAWKTKITRKHLCELYQILSQAGGSSYRPDNITYTRNGTFAFIDTEYPKKKPDYKSIRPYLREDMQHYWDKLVKKGGS